MSKKIRLGYDILSKRAIETESGVNIDEALKNITSYKRVSGTGEDNHPDVARPSTKVFYIVKVDGSIQPDTYKEWIWNQPENDVGFWECVGTNSLLDNSWKQWSEDHGSTGGDQSVYIGQNNQSDTEAPSYNLGDNNTTSGEPAENAVNPIAVNIGINNSIDGEGFNLGKGNTSDSFGVTLGQRNTSHNAAIVIGEHNEADHGSIALGKRAVDLYNSNYPALEIDGKFYPVVVSDLAPSTYHYTYRVGIDKDGIVQDISSQNSAKTLYDILYNSDTHQILINGIEQDYLSFTDSRSARGYTDDNGNFVETEVSPDPEHPIRDYVVYTFDDLDNPGETHTFIATRFTTEPLDTMVPTGYSTSYRCNVFYELKLGGIYERDFLIDKKMWFPVAYKSEDGVGGIWVDETQNSAIRCTYTNSSDQSYAPRTTIQVTGFDKDGTFYPYNGSNNDGATLYNKAIPTDQVVQHTFGGDEYVELGIKPLEEYADWVPADENSISVGDNQEVRSKSVGISSSTALLTLPSTGFGYDYTYRELTLDGESEEYTQTPVLYSHDSTANWPTPDTELPHDTVENGSIGIFNGAGPTPAVSSIKTSSIGIGTANSADTGSIVIGQSSSAQENSLILGTGGMSAAGNSVVVGRGGATAAKGSMIFGMNGASADNGAMAIGLNTVSASEGALAMGCNGVSARKGSITVGTTGSSATNGSITVGFSGAYATDGSITVGTNGCDTSYGSFAFGDRNHAYYGSCAIGMQDYAYQGAFTFGRNAQAEFGGINISSSGYTLSTGRSASGSIVKYRNPDGVYVPVKGALIVKSGYTIQKVRMLSSTYTYDDKQCWVVIGEYDPSNGYFNNYGTYPYLYDTNGNYVGSAERDKTMSHSYYGATSEYWRIYDGSKYTFIRADKDDPSSGYNATLNLKSLKTYFQVSCRTFMQDGAVYVYADGFNYPDDNLSYRNIDVSDCTFDVSDYWTGEMLGYTKSDWHQMTDGGAYGQGIAIGRQAHAYGSSFAVSTNYSDSFGYSVGIENYVSANPDSLPTTLGVRISDNYAHANGMSFAMGSNIVAEGSSMAIGKSTVRAYGESIAIGCNTNTADEHSLAIGRNSNTASDNSFAIGQDSNFATGYSFAVGTSGNRAQGYSVAFGYSNSASDMSYAFGKNSTAENYSVTFGNSASAYYHSMAVGDGTRALDYSISLGRSSIAMNNSIAVGDNLEAAKYSVNIGRSGSAQNHAVSMGWSNTAAHYSVAFGRENSAGGYPSTTDNSNAASIAMGIQNTAVNFGIALGRWNTAYARTLMIGESNGVNSSGSPFGTLIGHENSMETNGYNTALGYKNNLGREAVALGVRNNVYGWSIAIGTGNSTPASPGGHATIIGYNNQSLSDVETRTWEDTSSSTTYYLPLNSYYEYSWSEQIYTPDEIGPSGYIGSLSFYVSNNPTTRYLNIYLANTTKDSFTENYDWVLASSATLVFSGDVSFNIGWNDIALNTSFQYDDTKNLCVIILDNTGSWTSEIYFKCMSPNDGIYRSIYTCQDSYSYNPSSSSTYGELSDNRPFIKFVIGGSTVSVPKIVPLSGSIPTNSILMGALNESNHFNSILIGVGNQSDSPHIIRDGEHYNTDDDDGFMIAVGRENYVGRNYDIAIGYKSVAYGGENIAIQHSTARGFGNIALEQSSIAYGVRNFAMFDSVLESNASGTEIKFNKDVLANVLVDSKLIGAYNMRRNTVMHTNMETSASSTERNIIRIGVRKTSEYNDGHTVRVINATTFNDNIMIGARNGNQVSFSSGSDITLSGGNYAIDRNILLNNAYAHLSSSGGGCCDNTCISAELDIESVYFVHDNFISNSVCQVAAPYRTLAANAFMARSEVTGSNHSNYSIDRNFVFASYMHCTPDNTVSHLTSISDITSNVLFGSTANMVQRCFSFSNSYNSESSDSAYLAYAQAIINFGDANIYDSSDLFTYGDGNRVERTRWGILMGNHNKVAANAANDAIMYRINVIGNDNTVSARYGSENYHDTAAGITVIGNNNNALYGKFVFDNRIIGNNNYIASYTGLQTWTEQQINSIVSVDYLRIFTPANRCIHVTGTTTYLGGGNYYYYYNNAVAYVYPAPSEPYASMSASAFSTAYRNGTLTNDSFYYITGSSSYNLPEMQYGDIVNTGKLYYINDNSTSVNELSPDDTRYYIAKCGVYSSEDAHNASRNLIIGDVNGVYSNTVGYSVLGSGNIVRNTQVDPTFEAYAISNGFVQGNNNVAMDGSNIIAMGNGHVATGHNSVAIGMQLISDQWQTVLGKYNEPIDGPDRLTPASDSSQANKAIFMIGNGYSETDGDDWQDESQIHRSNAMVVYADGTVTAKAFVSDEPTLTLTGEVDQNGTGINVTETATTATISLDSDTVAILNIIKNRPTTGRCVLESNNGTLSWVSIGTQTV